MTRKEYQRTIDECYLPTKNTKDNIYSVNNIKKLLKKVKYPKLKGTKVEYDYGKGICKCIRSPEKISNHPVLQLCCNGISGRNYRVSSKAKKILKKYSKRKQKQWLIREINSLY